MFAPEVTFSGKGDFGSRGLVMNGQGQGRHPHLAQLPPRMLHQNVGLASPHRGELGDRVFPGQNGDDDPANRYFTPICRGFGPTWGFFE